MKKNTFNHFAKTMLMSACICMAATVFDINAYPVAKAYAQETKEEKTEFEYYEGIVNHGVNVRVGAGSNQDKLTVDGKGVSLAAGTKVVILEVVDLGGKDWYHIRFTYKDQELTGYSTSTYIDKNGVVITPTPMPTPTSTPTPAPTKEPEPVVTLAPAVTQVPQETKPVTTSDSKTSKAIIWIVLGLGCVGVVGVVIYLVKKNQKENEVLSNSEVARKVNNLKSLVSLSENERSMKRKNTNQTEKEIETKASIPNEEQVKVVKRNRSIKKSELTERREDVYVIASEEENEKAAIMFGSDDEIEANEKDRKALRQAVNRLREHDIIIHKYFGRGEVYDNSDVRLIEVRFHGDARFLNKDQLVNKHLIQITNERSI